MVLGQPSYSSLCCHQRNTSLLGESSQAVSSFIVCFHKGGRRDTRPLQALLVLSRKNYAAPLRFGAAFIKISNGIVPSPTPPSSKWADF